MNKKKSNKLLAPIVIAGITVGFLVSAYKFVFQSNEGTAEQHQDNDNDDQEELDVE